MLYILRIEIDAHLRGGPAPRPWVAEITGPCPKYGLARTFIEAKNDWAGASVAWSGNTYGVVAHYALHDGRLYEASRCRGRSSKRHVVREFYLIESGKRQDLEPEDVLTRVTGGGTLFRIDEDRTGGSWVAHVSGLGTPTKCPFIVVDDRRLYCLPAGLYEVVEQGRRRFIGVQDGVERLTEKEAMTWLTRSNDRSV